MTNINVLGEAKNECTDKLCSVITPITIEVMLTLYNDALQLSKGKQQLQQFQKLLQEVKTWNDSIIFENTKRICDSCNYFRDILTAIFICYTKIMSSIRLGKVSKSISLKIPKNEIFVHNVFKELAESLYNDPHFLKNTNNYDIKQEMHRRTRKAIESSVKQLVPLDEIFKTYIAIGDEHLLEDSESESSDPEVSSDVEEEESQPANEFPEPAEEEENEMPMEPMEEDEMPESLEESTKKIISFGDEEPAEEEEEETLFEDAREKNIG